MNNEKINRIKQFLTTELWRTTGRENLPFWRKVLYSLLKVLTLTVRGFQSKDLAIKANGLTYSLTFAIVPILAMVLAIAKGFGFDAIIDDGIGFDVSAPPRGNSGVGLANTRARLSAMCRASNLIVNY